jgi:Leucine-rich repeat (LRR) protein
LIFWGLDDNSNGQIDHEEVLGVSGLTLDNKNINDFKGLEQFTTINDLSISGNNLTAIDLTGFTDLRNLDCSNNKN